MNNEIAFRLSADCKLYQQYMASREQQIKFRSLARHFASKHFGSESMTFRMCKTLFCNYDTPGQTCKRKSGDLYQYKSRSALQKAWEDEVFSQIDDQALNNYEFWWIRCINRGSYSLWDHGGTVYGYLSSKEDKPKLPDGAEEIKMSEYYQIIEEIEAKEKADA